MPGPPFRNRESARVTPWVRARTILTEKKHRTEVTEATEEELVRGFAGPALETLPLRE